MRVRFISTLCLASSYACYVKSFHRNRVFDLLRIVFATLVILSHAFELTDGNRSRELFGRLTRSRMSFGEFGVDGFFLLSGFLIVQSWQRDPKLPSFLSKRMLRIVPGYFVAALSTTLVVGLLAPAVPHFFSHLGGTFALSILFEGSPFTPRAFPGTQIAVVNGSLWTIAYEFRCYLFVAFLGSLGLLRRRIWLALTFALLCTMLHPGFARILNWTQRYQPERDMILGVPEEAFRLTAIFFIGGCYYLFRERIRFLPWTAGLATLLFVCVDLLLPSRIEVAVVLCGSYLLFYLGEASSGWAVLPHRFPDISYGIYLYGWPVLGLSIWYLHASPWFIFCLATAICCVLGWLSWHFIERPMLALKRRPTAPVPAA